jgi:hypothetical protein
MLNFLIIFGVWITPGILLFLYLLWTIKRPASPASELHASAVSNRSLMPETEPSVIQLVRPAALAPARIRERA